MMITSFSSSLSSTLQSSTLSATLSSIPPEITINDDFQSKLSHAKQMIFWAIHSFNDQLIMSTSFGIQSAVLLHMATSLKSNISTVWIDTGYLPPETYIYALQLKEVFSINLKIYQAEMSPAHMEAIYGRLWESHDPEERRLYGLLRKVIPMKRAQQETNAKCVLIGLRKLQTEHRSNLQQLEYSEDEDCYKLYPLLNWTDDDIRQYFEIYQIPPHPLAAQGYTTVGDAHSSRPKTMFDEDDRITRFGGTGQQECGLHTESGTLDFLQSISASTSQKAIEQHLASSPLSVLQFPSDIGDLRCQGSAEYSVFTRSSCKFCRAAKALLFEKGFQYYEVDVVAEQTNSSHRITSEQLTSLVQKTRNDPNYPVTTVPQIFHQGQHIGGFTDLCTFLSLSESEKDKYYHDFSL